MTNPPSSEAMAQRATVQRLRLQHSVAELGSSIRVHLEPENVARKHVWSLATGAAAMALLLGYGVAGLFRSE